MRNLCLFVIGLAAIGIAHGAENTGIYYFVDCSAGDLSHLVFRDTKGVEVDFGQAGRKNQLGGLTLCAGPYEDEPNKALVGKPFRIKWNHQETQVYLDPPNWSKVGLRAVPTIISIKQAD